LGPLHILFVPTQLAILFFRGSQTSLSNKELKTYYVNTAKIDMIKFVISSQLSVVST